jgi:hypothetical protein
MNEDAKRQYAQERSRRRVKIATYLILAGAALLAIYIYIQSIPPPAGMYDTFAKCIANTGTKFYGAFWCPHCQNQKREFGSSADFLPYVECSLPDESGQTQICIDKGVKSYPTWVFPDGSQLTGEVSLATLSEKTGCALPGDTSATSSTSGSSSGAASPAL